MKRKKSNPMVKDALGIVSGSVVMGVGSTVLGRVGSTSGQQAISNLSGYMPLMGKVAGASYALKSIKKIKY